MNNKDLFVLLNIPDDGSYNISDISEHDSVRTVSISRPPSPTFCPYCNHIMHSRGIKIRTVNHPILQDGSSVVLKVHQRRWKCTHCRAEENESYPFLNKFSHSSSITPLLILDALKDLNRSAVSVARQFHVSDSTVHNIFSQYVDLKRLPLPEYISVDEVYMDISSKELYAFVIMDFITGQIVDIVHNRWSSTLHDYFYHIPREERLNVKAVISDAYGPYQSLCETFFPNAISVLDSFHVVKYINNQINIYLNEQLKKYRKLQQEKTEILNEENHTEVEHMKDSKEIVLLRDYRWLILKDNDSIKYSSRNYYQKKLGMYLNTFEIEEMLFKVDSNLKTIRDLKELYISFNSSSYKTTDEVRTALNEVISEYGNSSLAMFRDFAGFLINFRENIIASFTTVECIRKNKKDQQEYYSRLSNGPMEGFNRKPKDYKRSSRGFSNFDYTRNRILWATRINPPILAVPKQLKEVHIYHKKRKRN